MEIVETGEIHSFTLRGKKKADQYTSTGFHYKTFTDQRHPPFSNYFHSPGPDQHRFYPRHVRRRVLGCLRNLPFVPRCCNFTPHSSSARLHLPIQRFFRRRTRQCPRRKASMGTVPLSRRTRDCGQRARCGVYHYCGVFQFLAESYESDGGGDELGCSGSWCYYVFDFDILCFPGQACLHWSCCGVVKLQGCVVPVKSCTFVFISKFVYTYLDARIYFIESTSC